MPRIPPKPQSEFPFALCRPALAQEAQSTTAAASGILQVRAGATYRRLFDIPVYAGEMGIALGKWNRRGGDYFTFDFVAPGRTENGREPENAFRQSVNGAHSALHDDARNACRVPQRMSSFDA